MPKVVNQYLILPLLRKFINEVKKGKHLQANGKRIRTGSLQNYLYLEKLLWSYSKKNGQDIRINVVNPNRKKQYEQELKYWKKFYTDFSNYLYEDLGHFDNYVGMITKLLRSFFNYLQHAKGINVGTFHKSFFVASEEIEIVVLSLGRDPIVTYKDKRILIT